MKTKIEIRLEDKVEKMKKALKISNRLLYACTRIDSDNYPDDGEIKYRMKENRKLFK